MDTQLELPVNPLRRHATHEMRTPSLEAHGLNRNALGSRSLNVLAWLKANGPATARQIVDGIGFKDMNCVRPRLTELRKLGLVREQEKAKDQLTGINVFVYACA